MHPSPLAFLPPLCFENYLQREAGNMHFRGKKASLKGQRLACRCENDGFNYTRVPGGRSVISVVQYGDLEQRSGSLTHKQQASLGPRPALSYSARLTALWGPSTTSSPPQRRHVDTV